MRSSLTEGPRRLVISESGLYKLIMRSDKPQAKAFQDWVTKDVLPAIRKDGHMLLVMGYTGKKPLRGPHRVFGRI